MTTIDTHLTPHLVCLLAAPTMLAAALALDGSTNVLAARNHAQTNDSDGIKLVSIEDAVIERRRAVGNGKNVISVGEPGNIAAGNGALDNHDIGIVAPHRTIGGGHQQAHGNLAAHYTAVACR
jgi:hypothetical protein